MIDIFPSVAFVQRLSLCVFSGSLFNSMVLALVSKSKKAARTSTLIIVGKTDYSPKLCIRQFSEPRQNLFVANSFTESSPMRLGILCALVCRTFRTLFAAFGVDSGLYYKLREQRDRENVIIKRYRPFPQISMVSFGESIWVILICAHLH